MEEQKIPELPKTKKKLRELRKKKFKVLYTSELSPTEGGGYGTGGVSMRSLRLQCPFCDHVFGAIEKIGCFSYKINPACCPKCSFSLNIDWALFEIYKKEAEKKKK